ncbi:MAG: Pseudogene of site-specific DNA-methyltransferase [Methanobrevibacter sp. CfCl-M3]
MIESKLNGESKDILEENITKLKELFPEIVTDGKIDFEALKIMLGGNVEESNERYGFNWYGKSKTIKIAQEESTGTLRPCKEESKNYDTTENLYIEGDNLEVLKILQNSYQNKIKMIYIDPPYNTGNDFIYKDNYKDNLNNYLEKTSQVDEKGKLKTNSEESGRYHTNWLNMMYPRLMLARNLLTDDGVIFISIDDNEVENLKKICNEIFGENNFISQIVWQSTGGSNTGTNIVTVTEYILVYSKTKSLVPIKLSMKKGNWKYSDEYEDNRGKYERQKLDGTFTASHFSQSLVYPIKLPNDETIYPGGLNIPSGMWNWRWSQDKVNWGLENGFIEFVEKEGKYIVYFKNYEFVDNNNKKRIGSVPPKNIILTDIATTASGSNEIKELFDNPVFEFPKSVAIYL